MIEAPTDPLALFSVKDKVAIVTGASGAFGAVAAQTLASAGTKLVLTAGKAKELTEVADNCRKRGADVEEIVGRPSTEVACDAMVAKAVERFGRVDILVVASGKNDVAKIVEMSPERFLDVMDANVTQSWLMSRSVGRQMLAQGDGGKIILMSSARGLLGHPAGYTAYCASKSAVDGMTRALGCEWGATTSGLPPPGQAFSRGCRKAASARPAIFRGRCCSSLPRRRISTPVTSFTRTAVIRRADPWRSASRSSAAA
jgi:NAD(P)-dependent dehydrogenase (short-subunit alcohol dehydrogenase family)